MNPIINHFREAGVGASGFIALDATPGLTGGNNYLDIALKLIIFLSTVLPGVVKGVRSILNKQ